MNPTPRQQPVPLSAAARARLQQRKNEFDQQSGRESDWGEFLNTIALLGLAALGLYAISKATQRSPESVNVHCVKCQGYFIMAVPANSPRAVQTVCPLCNEPLVVNLVP
jgi:hypothetical protein